MVKSCCFANSLYRCKTARERPPVGIVGRRNVTGGGGDRPIKTVAFGRSQ